MRRPSSAPAREPAASLRVANPVRRRSTASRLPVLGVSGGHTLPKHPGRLRSIAIPFDYKWNTTMYALQSFHRIVEPPCPSPRACVLPVRRCRSGHGQLPVHRRQATRPNVYGRARRLASPTEALAQYPRCSSSSTREPDRPVLQGSTLLEIADCLHRTLGRLHLVAPPCVAMVGRQHAVLERRHLQPAASSLTGPTRTPSTQPMANRFTDGKTSFGPWRRTAFASPAPSIGNPFAILHVNANASGNSIWLLDGTPGVPPIRDHGRRAAGRAAAADRPRPGRLEPPQA